MEKKSENQGVIKQVQKERHYGRIWQPQIKILRNGAFIQKCISLIVSFSIIKKKQQKKKLRDTWNLIVVREYQSDNEKKSPILKAQIWVIFSMFTTKSG